MPSQTLSLQLYPSCQSLPLFPRRHTPGDTTSKALMAQNQLKIQHCTLQCCYKPFHLPVFPSKSAANSTLQGDRTLQKEHCQHTQPPRTNILPGAAATQRRPAPGPGCLGPCCWDRQPQGRNLPLTYLFWSHVGVNAPLSQLQSDPGGANECLPCLAN